MTVTQGAIPSQERTLRDDAVNINILIGQAQEGSSSNEIKKTWTWDKNLHRWSNLEKTLRSGGKQVFQTASVRSWAIKPHHSKGSADPAGTSLQLIITNQIVSLHKKNTSRL